MKIREKENPLEGKSIDSNARPYLSQEEVMIFIEEKRKIKRQNGRKERDGK